MDWRAEADGHMARLGHFPPRVKHLVEPCQPDGNDWDVQPGSHHGNSRTERLDFSMIRPFSLWKNQDRKPVIDEIARVPKGLPRAGLALRQRERVEEGSGEPVVQAVGEPLLARVLPG